MIDINKIIDVDLEVASGEEEYGVNIYATAVYLVDNTEVTVGTATLLKSYEYAKEEYAKEEYKGKNDALLFNVYQYFVNGGQKLVICPLSSYTFEAVKNVLSEVRKLASDFIFVVLSKVLSDKFNGTDSENLFSLCKKIEEELSSPYKVRLCLTTNDISFIKGNGLFNYSVAVKYNTIKHNKKLVDAALLIPAYFSQIELDENSTIKDYCYTAENLYDSDYTDVNFNGVNNVTSGQYDVLVSGNYNFIDKIGNNIINFGGNYANGNAITLDFGAIAIENEICYEVLNSVVGKQYLTENGLTNVSSIIDAIMMKYVNNGFIQTQATYSGKKYEYNYNKVKYLVVDENELLEKGYKVFTIPISNITREDYRAKRFTPIIIAMETNKGARTIMVRGVVR